MMVAGSLRWFRLPWFREGDDGGCRRRWMQVVCSRSRLQQVRERMAVVMASRFLAQWYREEGA